MVTQMDQKDMVYYNRDSTAIAVGDASSGSTVTTTFDK